MNFKSESRNINSLQPSPVTTYQPPPEVPPQPVNVPPQPFFQPSNAQALKFSWICVDEQKFPDIFIPVITRVSDSKKYLSVRIIETAILDKYENVASDEIKQYGTLKCVYCEPDEVNLLNEINETHTDNFDYGRKKFDMHDTLVTLADFQEFYSILSRTCKTKDEVQLRAIQQQQLQQQLQRQSNIKNQQLQRYTNQGPIAQFQRAPAYQYPSNQINTFGAIQNNIDFTLINENSAALYNPTTQLAQTSNIPNHSSTLVPSNYQSLQILQMQKRIEAQQQQLHRIQPNDIFPPSHPQTSCLSSNQRHPQYNHDYTNNFNNIQQPNSTYTPNLTVLPNHRIQYQQPHRLTTTTTTQTTTTTMTTRALNPVQALSPHPPIVHQSILAANLNLPPQSAQLQQMLNMPRPISPLSNMNNTPGIQVRPISPYQPPMPHANQDQIQSNLQINIPRHVHLEPQLNNTPTPPLTPSPNVANLVNQPASQFLARVVPNQAQPVSHSLANPNIQLLSMQNPVLNIAAAAARSVRSSSRDALQSNETQMIRDVQNIINKEASLRARSLSSTDASRDLDINKQGALNTPPPLSTINTAPSTSKGADLNNDLIKITSTANSGDADYDIIVLDDSGSSSNESSPTSSPQKSHQSQNSQQISLFKQATSNLAKKQEKINESYNSKPHGYIQINDMILPYVNLTEKGYIICEKYPKCIKYVCIKHLAECNIIRVDAYADKSNLKNLFKSYQIANEEQIQCINELVHKLSQIPAIKLNNRFVRSDRYDLINLSELFAQYFDKALYLQELDLDSIPDKICTNYNEILNYTGGILQYIDPDKKKKHIQPFVDFNNKKYVCNLNINKAIHSYNLKLQQQRHAKIQMSPCELDANRLESVNMFYQLLLFYMNIKYEIKSRKIKLIDIKDAVDKLPGKFRILCSFTSQFPTDWVEGINNLSARKATPISSTSLISLEEAESQLSNINNTHTQTNMTQDLPATKETAIIPNIQLSESVSLSPNSMDSGSPNVSPLSSSSTNKQNEPEAQQTLGNFNSIIEDNISSIVSDLSKSYEPNKICVISEICSLNNINTKTTQILSLSVINAHNEANSTSISKTQNETIKNVINENQNENEKENSCNSNKTLSMNDNLKAQQTVINKNKPNENLKITQDDQNKIDQGDSSVNDLLDIDKRKSFSDDVLHRKSELEAYFELRTMIKSKNLAPNMSYLNKLKLKFKKCETDNIESTDLNLDTAQTSSTPYSHQQDDNLNVSVQNEEEKEVDTGSREFSNVNMKNIKEIQEKKEKDTRDTVKENVVFDLIYNETSNNPCTSKSLEENDDNLIQSIQDLLNFNKNNLKKKDKKGSNIKNGSKDSIDLLSVNETDSISSEFTSASSNLDLKLSKQTSSKKLINKKCKRKIKNKKLRVNKKKKLSSSSNESSYLLDDSRSEEESDDNSLDETDDYDDDDGFIVKDTEYTDTLFYHQVDAKTQNRVTKSKRNQNVRNNIQSIEKMRLNSDLFDTGIFDEGFFLKKYNIKKCSVKLKRMNSITIEALLNNNNNNNNKTKIKKTKKTNRDKLGSLIETSSVKSMSSTISTSSSKSSKSSSNKKSSNI